MGIFRDLLGNFANTRMMEEQQKLQRNQALGDSLIALLRNDSIDPNTGQPAVPVGMKIKASTSLLDLLGKHGGKQGREMLPTINQMLTGYLTSQAQNQTPPGQQPQPGEDPTQPSRAPQIPTVGSRDTTAAGQPQPQRAMPASLAGMPPTAAQPPQRGGAARVGRGFGNVLRGLAGVGGEMLGIPRGGDQGIVMKPEWFAPAAAGFDLGSRSETHFQMPDGSVQILHRQEDGSLRDPFGRSVDMAQLRQAGAKEIDKPTATQVKPWTKTIQGDDPNLINAAKKLNRELPDPKKSYIVVPDAEGKIADWYVAATPSRALSPTMEARQTAYGAYATHLGIKPEALTDEQKLQALLYARNLRDEQGDFEAGPKTKANPTGDPYIDLLAQDYIWYDKLPSAGMSGAMKGDREAALRRGAEMLQMAGYSPADLPNIRDALKSNGRAFDRIVVQEGALMALEGTITANAETARTLSAKYDRTSVPFVNRLEYAWRTNTGDSDALAFAGQLHILATEWAKVMGGSMSNAQVPVSSQQDAEAIISKYLSNRQFNELLNNVIIPDMQNRKAAQGAEKGVLQRTIRDISGLTPGAVPQPPKMNPEGLPMARTPGESPSDDIINQYYMKYGDRGLDELRKAGYK